MAARKTKKSAPRFESIEIQVLPDEDPDTSYLDQDDFDERRDQYQRGDFYFVGIRAVAEVVVKDTIQEMSSGGLWGIESDSDRSYIEEVAKEEYDSLCEILRSIGLPSSQIPKFDPRSIHWKT